MCFLRQHEIYLWYLPGTACLNAGPSPVDLACLRNHLLHACRYWYGGCHPQDTAAGRDRTHYSFSSIHAVVYGYSSNIARQVGWFTTYDNILVFICILYATLVYCSLVFVWYVHTLRTLLEAKQGCRVVASTSFSYCGAYWSKVLALTWYLMYVREFSYFWFFIEIFRSLSRCLVVR